MTHKKGIRDLLFDVTFGPNSIMIWFISLDLDNYGPQCFEDNIC